MSSPTITPAPYTSLGDLQSYKDLPVPVKSFATLVAGATYELCGFPTNQIRRASCFAQFPDASRSLMAMVNTDNYYWTQRASLSTGAAQYIPSVSSAYSEWLGQEAVQALVSTIAIGGTSTKPTISVPSANTTSSRPQANGFDRLSVVEKVFTIIGVVIGVIVPITIFLLTRRHLKKNREATVVDPAQNVNLNGSEPPEVIVRRGGGVDEKEKKKWRFQSPISRS